MKLWVTRDRIKRSYLGHGREYTDMDVYHVWLKEWKDPNDFPFMNCNADDKNVFDWEFNEGPCVVVPSAIRLCVKQFEEFLGVSIPVEAPQLVEFTAEIVEAV